MKTLCKIALACLMLYGLLYWAVSNPNSASNMKESIDGAASIAADKAKKVADALVDDEDLADDEEGKY